MLFQVCVWPRTFTRAAAEKLNLSSITSCRNFSGDLQRHPSPCVVATDKLVVFFYHQGHAVVVYIEPYRFLFVSGRSYATFQAQAPTAASETPSAAEQQQSKQASNSTCNYDDYECSVTWTACQCSGHGKALGKATGDFARIR
ncbi:hypothetical protein EKPV-NSW-ORF007 [Eastern grey kangaroopox virus]|uniref:Uncharacterized protein n=1 Tax=Eastern grey kangaroopox virus TaxID=2042482 RepID=A0A2H4QTB0_9POXV|nr:hypothetical protein EKPV-NSW-ORF007 [Eastern grey kangaroopox virus]